MSIQFPYLTNTLYQNELSLIPFGSISKYTNYFLWTEYQIAEYKAANKQKHS